MSRLVDSHCHLDFEDFADERGEVIARARRAGVGTLVTICTKITEFPSIRAIAETDPDIWCTVGIHPHEAASQPDTDEAALVEYVGHPKVIGVGECGLDYHYDYAPRDRQAEVFRTHARAARRAGVPMVVHTREADADTARLLTEESDGGRLAGVLHCFTSGRELAMHGLDLGFYVSFSGIITFKSAADLREIVKAVPLDRLLVETDAPYLAPVPMRGKRNEPAFVVHTAAAIAAMKGVSAEELASITTENFHRLFTKAAKAA
ncbi:MAG: TatD-related deoxyribonuclease [Rhodospirillales bacterium]|nr:TatD-related deoxyribonuclease [Rhodospirillales bacterium]